MTDLAATFALAVAGPAARCHIALGHGALAALPPLLRQHAPAFRYAVVADPAVVETHARTVVDGIRDDGGTAHLVPLPGAEAPKSLRRWAELLESLGDMGLGRDGAVIAVGGGLTGDLAGFAAAAFARGVPFVQVPTTLLAMVDAAYGGKTGADLRAGRNLAGAFHHPRLVLVDPATLDTLPDHALVDGLAEAVKHGAIADAAYLDWMVRAAPDILRRDNAALERLVAGSIRIKIDIVDRDPTETGERAILNFGHTIAHALERVTDHALPHGHAVAMGMVVEARIGQAMGMTEQGTARSLREALRALHVPHALPDHLALDPQAIMEATRSDKKARQDDPRYALLKAPGTAARTPQGAWTHPAPAPTVLQALTALRV